MSVERHASASKTTRVLIIEDDFLIADYLQAILEDLECEVAGSFGSVPEAVAASGLLEIDAAIIDLVLHGERADCIADVLTLRGVPFAFASGMSPKEADGSWQNHPFQLPKPYTKDQLANVLRAMLAPSRKHEAYPADTVKSA